MELLKLLNNSLELLEKSTDRSISYYKAWHNPNKCIYISSQNSQKFQENLESIYSINKNIYSRFTRQKIYKYIEDEIVNKKMKNEIFLEENAKSFFKQFEEMKPYSRHIIAPISGIRLDKFEKINISIFEIGKTTQLKSILSNEQDGYYIAVKINNIYDELIAIEEAKNKFLDFIRIIVFISVRNDKTIKIKTGLPPYPSFSHERIYVESNSYQITENINDEFLSATINNIHCEKIPLDNDFFCKNESFAKLWHLYERQNNGKISQMEKRILNASIAIGESALSTNLKNSIIYTSMAFEILFSFDEGSLFQKSIGDKLADTFVFMACKDKDSRLNAIKLVKDFYKLRSALVHGGETNANNDYIGFNILLGAVISELLNNTKYGHIKNIDHIYSMVKEAQNSY